MTEPKHKNGLAERDWLRRENERLSKALWVAVEATVTANECLAESRKLVAELNGEIDGLKSELEAARKVADVAVEYQQFTGSVRDHIQFGAVLFAAVTEYRKLKEQSF